VAVAPNRRRRPGASAGLIEAPDQAELDECPFCAGHEDRTPPETFRIGTESSWTVRVVPNLYPAFERQEVVVHSPRHVRTFAELDDEEIEGVARAWHARANAMQGTEHTYLHPLINEGVAAGSSLAHSHSQLVYLRDAPPAARIERERTTCGVCEIRDGAGRSLELAEDNGAIAYVHPQGRLPYEMLIAAAHPDLDLTAALRLMRGCVRALRAVEGPVAWNAWLHNAWQGLMHQHVHPHIELVPRLTTLAGIELGAGIYVNTVAPEDAAAALRGAF
jgi:UDPglucose--hexose-1-phosphate uridylyltransferase